LATLVGAAVLATAVVSVRLHLHVAHLRYRLWALDQDRVRAEREQRLARADLEAAKAPRRLLERWTAMREEAAEATPAPGAAPPPRRRPGAAPTDQDAAGGRRRASPLAAAPRAADRRPTNRSPRTGGRPMSTGPSVTELPRTVPVGLARTTLRTVQRGRTIVFGLVLVLFAALLVRLGKVQLLGGGYRGWWTTSSPW
jgi:hypothetical protein